MTVPVPYLPAAAPPDPRTMRQVLRTIYTQDLEQYAANMLKIQPRGGGDRVPFTFKPAQRWLHHQLQAQLHERGFIRALLPKARQLGISAYTAARFFQKTTTQFGRNTYILTHKSEATANLFTFVKLFYKDLLENKPVLDMCPVLGGSNAKELIFPDLNGRYRVGTAEGTGVGVSTTNHLLHLSEVALYADVKDVSTGLMNTVDLAEGTEILMESTGRGPLGMFYSLCASAVEEKNQGMWKVYFLPWLWDAGYALDPPDKWQPWPELAEYARQYELTPRQTYWFHVKNQLLARMNGAPDDRIHGVMRQEYPITLDECFLSAAESAFFKPEFVRRAQFNPPRPVAGLPKVLGIDVGIDGGDPTFIADRQGTVLGRLVWEPVRQKDLNEQAEYIAQKVRQFRIDIVIVDVTGLGVGLFSLLKLKLQGVALIAINFSNSALDPRTYANRKAEMYDYFRLWLEQENMFMPTIPIDEVFVSELNAIQWGVGMCYRDSSNKLHVTQKEKVRELLLGKSPDRLEAAMLTTSFSDAQLNTYTR